MPAGCVADLKIKYKITFKIVQRKKRDQQETRRLRAIAFALALSAGRSQTTETKLSSQYTGIESPYLHGMCVA